MSSSNSPCAACKFLRRKCIPECVFAPYFPADQPQRFSNVHKVFGASNVAKLLNELPADQREDAVNSLAYEAEARLRDPVYGCVGMISLLQQRLKQIQVDLYSAKKELATYIGPSALMPMIQPSFVNQASTSGAGNILQPYTVGPLMAIPSGIAAGGPTLAGPSHAGPSHAGASHAGPSHAGPSHAGPSHAGPSHAGPSHAGPSHAGPSHAGLSLAGPSHAGPSHAGPSYAGLSLAGPSHGGGGSGAGAGGSQLVIREPQQQQQQFLEAQQLAALAVRDDQDIFRNWEQPQQQQFMRFHGSSGGGYEGTMVVGGFNQASAATLPSLALGASPFDQTGYEHQVQTQQQQHQDQDGSLGQFLLLQQPATPQQQQLGHGEIPHHEHSSQQQQEQQLQGSTSQSHHHNLLLQLHHQHEHIQPQPQGDGIE